MAEAININVVNKGFSELNPIDAGYEKCVSLHSYGPSIREYWLIHYVVSGCGKIFKTERTYTANPGQAFLIKPGEICKYTADEKTPWEYIWIGFTGTMAENFEKLGCVFDAPGQVFHKILRAADYKVCREEYLASMLFMLYTQIFSLISGREDYVVQAMNYIEAKYTSDITIGEISKIIGIDRCYLSKLFKSKTHVSMQDYLIDIRIKKATEFLQSGRSVSETATLVGYKDVFNFSKMYKKRTGRPPADIRDK